MAKNEMLDNGASTVITWWIYTIKKNKIILWIIYYNLLEKDKNKMNLHIQKTINIIIKHH